MALVESLNIVSECSHAGPINNGHTSYRCLLNVCFLSLSQRHQRILWKRPKKKKKKKNIKDQTYVSPPFSSLANDHIHRLNVGSQHLSVIRSNQVRNQIKTQEHIASFILSMWTTLHTNINQIKWLCAPRWPTIPIFLCKAKLCSRDSLLLKIKLNLTSILEQNIILITQYWPYILNDYEWGWWLLV